MINPPSQQFLFVVCLIVVETLDFSVCGNKLNDFYQDWVSPRLGFTMIFTKIGQSIKARMGNMQQFQKKVAKKERKKCKENKIKSYILGMACSNLELGVLLHFEEICTEKSFVSAREYQATDA